LDYASAPIVWGEAGTNGQHAFYQLIHQGGHLIPCEFLALIEPDVDLPGHHQKLLSHCFAQSEALMTGKTQSEAEAELGHAAAGTSTDREHKVAALGALWNINSFDQFGVELGKQLANRLLPMIEGNAPLSGVDSSTTGLIYACRRPAKR
jgi:glucose-6-phosphate isomerase